MPSAEYRPGQCLTPTRAVPDAAIRDAATRDAATRGPRMPWWGNETRRLPEGRPKSAQDGVDEGGRLERGHVVGAFAEADQLDRHAQFPLDGDDNAALGGPVKLGQDDPGDVYRLGEHAGLPEPVLAGGGVEDEQDLIHRGALLDDALDLAELVHQPSLGVQPAGGVHDDRVHPLGDAVTDR